MGANVLPHLGGQGASPFTILCVASPLLSSRSGGDE